MRKRNMKRVVIINNRNKSNAYRNLFYKISEYGQKSIILLTFVVTVIGYVGKIIMFNRFGISLEVLEINLVDTAIQICFVITLVTLSYLIITAEDYAKKEIKKNEIKKTINYIIPFIVGIFLYLILDVLIEKYTFRGNEFMVNSIAPLFFCIFISYAHFYLARFEWKYKKISQIVKSVIFLGIYIPFAFFIVFWLSDLGEVQKSKVGIINDHPNQEYLIVSTYNNYYIAFEINEDKVSKGEYKLVPLENIEIMYEVKYNIKDVLK